MYREIVTKAVVGKGKVANCSDVISEPINNISKVLGCWIINHTHNSCLENGKVFVKGKYEIHIWIGLNNDTETLIHKQTIDYYEEFSLNMKNKEEIKDNNELVIHCIKYPTCSGLVLNSDNTITAKIDKELNLDIIGEAKLKVQVSAGNDDDWNNDIDKINVNYLNE